MASPKCPLCGGTTWGKCKRQPKRTGPWEMFLSCNECDFYVSLSGCPTRRETNWRFKQMLAALYGKDEDDGSSVDAQM